MPININFGGPSLTECMLGDFSRIKKIDSRKARERELAAFDENRRAVGVLDPMRDKNLKARTGGEKGRHL